MEPKEILLELRTKHGLSQEQLAEKVYVTRQAVSRWETGETVPNTETLKLLSKLFDVSINTLAGLAPTADLSVLRHAPGGRQYQPGARWHFQRRVLQMVLFRRKVCLYKS